MSQSLKSLILCVHAHQPVGNFDNVIEEAYEKSYRPFFEVLEKHPSILFSCHFSGSLMDWLLEKKPEFIEKLKKLHGHGQLEFLGGGYYEPIYGVIPRQDLAGQIEMMRKVLASLFGEYPKGAWLTERVWDPDLVKPLRKANVEYTILDDLHLERGGVPAPVTGFYQAKQDAVTLDLFASLKDLRYLVPFRKPEETIEFIRTHHLKERDAFVFADDLEKFGLWPSTHHWVYKEGWLDQFFTLLEKDKTIKLYTFSGFRRAFSPKGAVKVSHASYSEMMEWSGGHFYNFFKKYPESQYMRDRMLGVSRALAQARRGMRVKEHEDAQRALYRAQCNCSYWHGVFGGLYLHHLRSAVFENLIRAERILSRMRGRAASSRPPFQIENLKSGMRWKVSQKDTAAFFNPRYGAALEEWDYLPLSVNLMCNLRRHREVYHETVLAKTAPPKEGRALSIHEMLGSKEENLEKHLHYDVVRRLSFLDHFFEEPVGLENFYKSLYDESGDFLEGPYQKKPGAAGRRELCFERKGFVSLHRKKHPLRLTKRVLPKGSAGLKVRYDLKNESRVPLDFVFGVEFNFSIGTDHPAAGLAQNGVKQWVFHDTWRGLRIRLRSKEAVDLLAVPVETVSESESGLERTYQELGVLLQRSFSLKPGQVKSNTFELEVC
ncbi:MAG: DUF1926 domain-containing protein [Candidatus Omnitrophica bacterium]|nr:DUF1926 domain-containing protein [Candidatus Omnitrophota bacterium]